MKEFKQNPELIYFNFQEKRKTSNQKNKFNSDNLREFGFEMSKEFERESIGLYLSEHSAFTVDKNDTMNKLSDNSTPKKSK